MGQYQPGQVIHEYSVLQFLGEGGIATVYLGERIEDGKRYAIKVIKPTSNNFAQFGQRFIREARIMMRLNHPNILKVHHFANDSELVYMTMDYIDGGNLSELIEKEHPLDLSRVTSIMTQVAEALNYAHSQDVIHRDIKPHNIMLDRQDNAYLCDFGMVKQLYAETQLTEAGTVMGTPEYMSPEQANAEPANSLSDLYSLGIILYEMLCGEVPFIGKNPVMILTKQISEKPASISDCRPDLPPAINDVVQKALAKNPKHRYQSATDLMQAFTEAAASTPKESPRAAQTLPKKPTSPLAPSVSPSPTVAHVPAEEEGPPLRVLMMIVAGVVIIGILFAVAMLFVA